jgi:hypothetical protein
MGWVVGLMWVGTLGFIVYLYIQSVAALHSGQSRVAALEATQHQFLQIASNPWFLAVYLSFLVILLFQVVRRIYGKTDSRNDY